MLLVSAFLGGMVSAFPVLADYYDEQATLYAGKYDFEYSNGACNKNPMEKPFDGKYTYASDANGDALKVGDTIILLDLAGAGLYAHMGM